MIPSAITRQLEQGLSDFLRFSFWSSTPGMERVVDRLLEDEGMLFKGPYLSVKMPFKGGENLRTFPDVPLGFQPHHHQEQVFARLGGRRKESTLLATGTGSGKTESFLLPILDHCLQFAHEPGVKAILIYPMNALASDQAGRIARLIHRNEKLRGRVSAGLYVGDGGGAGSGKGKGKGAGGRGARGETRMGADRVITDRAAMRDSPPNILLTNYKMLDYLLLRPADQKIWQHNRKGTLRFVVVDEIHTFDGAQGTDLACLLRRLKRRLEVDDGSLACVGTSATLGGEDARDQLRDYAEKVFGEPFGEDAIVGETRQRAEDFLEGFEILHFKEPGPGSEEHLDAARAVDPDAWLAAQEGLFFSSAPGMELREGSAVEWLAAADEGPTDEAPADARAVALGQRLRHHATFQGLLRALEAEGGAATLDGVVARMARSRSEWRDHPELGRFSVLALLGLVSKARSWRHELPDIAAERRAEGRQRPVTPFLDVQVQLWQRELVRLVATVEPEPRLRHSDDLDRQERERHLPMVHCRDCGALGWATMVDRDQPNIFRCELQRFYAAFFGNDPRVHFLFPATAWPEQDNLQQLAFDLDLQSLIRLNEAPEPEAQEFSGRRGGSTLRVIAVARTRSSAGRQILVRDCPFCSARESLTIVGFKAATLTSVHIDQLFASPFNGDKKLLTFSDSVQDAAHRAGFFAARTWRTNLRIAILRLLQQLGEPTLAELAAQLGPWAQREHDVPTYVATFLAPNMAWMHDWDALRRDGELPADSDLPRRIATRLAYEVATEFSLHAEIGRSLTRAACAVADVRPADLAAAVEGLLEPLRNEVPGLRGVEPQRVEHFVLGLLQHLRLQGGVLAQSLPAVYVERGGSSFALSNDYNLPDYGKSFRLPTLLTDRAGSRFDTWSRAGRGGESWYAIWADACFGGGPGLVADAGSLYPVVLAALVRSGVLEERSTARGAPVWGLREGALVVSSQTAALVCGACGHGTRVSAAMAPRWNGVPCLRASCPGVYRPDSQSARDYFGRLYSRGDLQRIFAEEHTGLLERGERERVEAEFKAPDPVPGIAPEIDPESRRPWHANLLSCTPTLEMGIDIGDLSSAILCSAPPGQASYLQRIGRAGRRDGNAFVLTVTAARPHDLYFFAQPEEMIAGDVPPPGVFLDAGAVLERQLTAFCIDRWVAEEGPLTDLPSQLQSVFSRLQDEDPQRFPWNLLSYVRRQRPIFLREFLEMFGDEIQQQTCQHLELFLLGGEGARITLETHLLDALSSELKQREAHRTQANLLQGQLKKLRETEVRNQDHDEQIEAREAEKAALLALVKAINQRSTLEFLTDQGLLPNYAFPESAVRLNSVIYRRKKQPTAQGSQYETWSYEYKRSPSSALSELVPGASFYASGRQVSIESVDLESSQIETWRFCPECSHAESIETGDPHSACPACGAVDWRDSGQKQRLLRLEQVFARSSDRKSRIRDERDDREPSYFERDMLPTFDAQSGSRAWRLDGGRHPFGFEYSQRVTFRDINFGERSELGARNLIAGRSAIRQGFELCTRCGKVQSRRGADQPAEHRLSCSASRSDAVEQTESCIYLYRQLESEALRFLVPITDFATTRQLSSFTAALQLGLKKYFAGSVDHLRTTVYSEPISGGSLRRQYLVLFDTVPGGTGFLKQLVTPDTAGQLPLFQVFKKSLEHIETCSCWGSTTSDGDFEDGCYRCLYAYRNSREMSETSARTAAEILHRIVEQWGSLEAIERLGDISVTGLLDSALEAHFLKVLERAGDDQQRASLRPVPIHAKIGWLWSLGEAEWFVEPQVNPPPAETGGIAVSIDFLLRPARATTDRRIAVLLDGWEYHHDRVAKDLRQRQALLAAGYDVWTLTWEDVEAELLPSHQFAAVPELLVPDPHAFEVCLRRTGQVRFRGLPGEPTLRWLLQELQAPEGLPWRDLAAAAMTAQFQGATAQQQGAWASFVDSAAPVAVRSRLASIKPRWTAGGAWGEPRLLEWMVAHDGENSAVLVRLDDREDRLELAEMRQAWRALWRLFQWLRTSSEAYFVAESGMGDFTSIVQLRDLQAHGPEESEARWEDFEEICEEYLAAAELLIQAGVPEPEVGWEIEGPGGAVWGEVELAWSERGVALTSRADVAAARGESPSDWELFYLEDLMNAEDGVVDVSPILAALQEETS